MRKSTKITEVVIIKIGAVPNILCHIPKHFMTYNTRFSFQSRRVYLRGIYPLGYIFITGRVHSRVLHHGEGIYTNRCDVSLSE